MDFPWEELKEIFGISVTLAFGAAAPVVLILLFGQVVRFFTLIIAPLFKKGG